MTFNYNPRHILRNAQSKKKLSILNKKNTNPLIMSNSQRNIEANVQIGVAKVEANAYSVQLGKVGVGKSSDGKVNASAQVQSWSGKNEDIGGSMSNWEGSSKGKIESKQALGLSVGLKNKLEVGASWERTEMSDRNGNKSDAKQKGSIGLTGDLTKGLPIRTGYETETMENGSKSLPTNSTLSLSGGALIIGGEVKVEIKTDMKTLLKQYFKFLKYLILGVLLLFIILVIYDFLVTGNFDWNVIFLFCLMSGIFYVIYRIFKLF